MRAASSLRLAQGLLLVSDRAERVHGGNRAERVHGENRAERVHAGRGLSRSNAIISSRSNSVVTIALHSG